MNRPENPKNCHGIALLVSLLILLITTLLALAGLRGTTLQERMSGNLYARGLVFQAAESILRKGEISIKNLPQPSDNSCPIAASEKGDKSFWTWLDEEKPEYDVENLGIGPGWGSEAECESGSDTTQYGSRCGELPNACYYRITGRLKTDTQSRWAWAKDLNLQVIVRRRLEQK